MTRVLVAGSFDLIHPGHIHLFEEAAKLGEVFVVVGRDQNILKIKGKLPTVPENQRLAVVKALKAVSDAVLGGVSEDFLEIPLSLNPDIFFLGPNQHISESFLRQKLDEHQKPKIKILRLKDMFTDYPLVSSSAIKEKIRNPN